MDGNSKSQIAIVRHPQYQEVWNRIQRCHFSIATRGRPENLRVLGVAGVGKSTLLKHYRQTHPSVFHKEFTEVPVVYTEVPAMPTSKQLAINLLKGLGCEDIKGTAPQMWDRFSFLTSSCRVQLIIIDEAQHFIDQGRLSTFSATADLLKQKISEINLPVIFSGAPRSRRLFENNNQLRSRFKGSINFYPFRIRTSEEFLRFKGVVATTVKKFTDSNQKIMLSDEIVQRLFYATDGIYRNLTDLVDGLEYLLNEKGVVSLELLSRAYKENIDANAFGENNPFSEAFDFRRLNQADEPFAPSYMDGDNHAVY